ncbi:MAG TPA: hypothetical protein VLS51_12135 [Propionibacteriaceae bacterium]|nr:hypothetical protein [Propionibacteriaceae bacterium]
MYAKIGSSRSESAGHVAGLMLYNSSSGKIVTWGPSLNGSFEYDHWNSVSSFSAASADAAYLPGPVVVYLKLTIDASGNIAYFRSPDGIAWLQSGTSTLASFLSSVTHIGFGMDIESSTIDQLACHWLRLR